MAYRPTLRQLQALKLVEGRVLVVTPAGAYVQRPAEERRHIHVHLVTFRVLRDRGLLEELHRPVPQLDRPVPATATLWGLSPAGRELLEQLGGKGA